MAKFLCAGDLHLGAGADLGNEPGARLVEQEAVWTRIVQLANELDVPLLFAGDAWERRRPTPEELLAFREPLGDLRREFIAVAGNHDVEAFARPTGYDVTREAAAGPGVVALGGALVACLPWAPPGKLVALEAGGDRDDLNATLAQGLVAIARQLFIEVEEERARRLANGATLPTPAILLGHWSVGGATTPTGVPAELFREPVLPLEELEAIGFDAMVFGHIHRPQMLGARGFYTGSPMPLNFGEAGCDHVVWLLDVEPGSFQAFQIPIESRRLITVTTSADKVLELPVDSWLPREVEGATIKVRITATPEEARRLDVGFVKREALHVGAHKVWSVQVDVERAEIVRGVELDESVDDREAMELWLAAAELDPLVAKDVAEMHFAYLEELKR